MSGVPPFAEAEGVASGAVVMKKAVWSGIATAAAVLCFSAPSFAQTTANGAVSVSAVVNARAKLTLGSPSISFADADPDVTASIAATALSVAVEARTTAAATVTLTMQATGDFSEAGGATIPINNLTWTVGGDAGFQAGTASSAAAQTVGSWTGSGDLSGTQTYSLVNSWAYNTGTYSVTLNYTLSAP